MLEESACAAPKLAAMGRPFTFGMQCAVVSFCVVIAHVEAIGVAHTDARSYSHWGNAAARNRLSGEVRAPLSTKFRPKLELRDPAPAVARNGQGDSFAEHNTEEKGGRERHQTTTRQQQSAFRRAELEFANENGSSDHEVAALMSFRAGISGGNATTAFQSWGTNDSTPCKWLGVSCSPAPEQHVIAVQLPSFQLTGNISRTLFALSKLPFLETVDFSDNKFISIISGPTLGAFSNLAFLNLSYNYIEGQIPHQIGGLSNLQSLALQKNQVIGTIPPSICNCTSLRVLNLEGNILQGQIPPSIGRLYQLEVLKLASDDPDTSRFLGNMLSGSIPPSLGNCSSLRILNLGWNSFGGQLPQELSLLRSLEILSLPSCEIQGLLPRWIGNLTTLEEARLSFNQFNGTIPAELGQLRNLSRLDLGYNLLTGSIPSQIANCTSLTALRLESNLLTGVITSALGNCKSLQVLRLGENPLMNPAPIPIWIGSLTELSDLDLTNTNRHGLIPSNLGAMSNLVWLSLDLNALHGLIPPSLLNCTLLQILTLGGNQLIGPIPPKLGLLANLSYFSVGSNFFTGPVPASITNMTQLSILDLSSNFLSGAIGGQWGLLSQLISFDVSNNLFSGSIPSTLGNCSSLFAISLDGNLLTGQIPTAFGNLAQLDWLCVSNNELSGNIPLDLTRCFALTALDLSGNNLGGPLPSDFSQLPLTYLNVSHNGLTGTISSALSSLTETITLLDLSYNRFTGSVHGVSFSQMLIVINISHNLVSGPLSFDWSSLEAIHAIDISANNFSGYFPNLRNLIFLEWLDISLNSFSGEIPQSLAEFPSLEFFNASYNNFAGPVPTFGNSASNVTLSAASFLGNPGLCGAILGPSRECGDNSSHSSGNCKGFHCPKKWIPVALASAICVWLAVALLVWWKIKRAQKNAAKEKEVFNLLFNFRPHVLKFAPADILAIINKEENIIGRSARSVVYKGSLPGSDVVAIKTFVGHQMEDIEPRELESWRHLLAQEASMQAKLRHRNILKVLSICSHLDFRALILEYMPQGSLHDHLYPQARDGQGVQWQKVSKQRCQLSWSQRLNIASDVANGMTYLHQDCPQTLIHSDLKPSNILLDDDMTAKVADFGISRLGKQRQKGGHSEPQDASVSKIRGAVGYMPPEYAYGARVSTKGDVFSNGVLLIELLTGRPPTKMDCPPGVDQRKWTLKRFQESPLEVLDPVLQQEAMMDALKYKQMTLLARAAFLCTRENPRSRPSMKDVASMLIQIKELEPEAATKRQVVNDLLESGNLSENSLDSSFSMDI